MKPLQREVYESLTLALSPIDAFFTLMDDEDMKAGEVCRTLMRHAYDEIHKIVSTLTLVDVSLAVPHPRNGGQANE